MGNPAWRVIATITGIACLLCLLLAGCGPDSGTTPTSGNQDPAPTATSRPSLSPVPTAAVPATVPAESYPQPVSLAITRAVEETGVDRERVRVVSYEEREWPSPALGCPQPGFSYPQVVTPGYFVRLEIEGEQRIYHTNRSTTVVDCTPAG